MPGSGLGPVAGCCEHGNEPSGSIKGSEFLEQSSDYQLRKKERTLLHVVGSIFYIIIRIIIIISTLQDRSFRMKFSIF
jgi:hypothetical protein